MQRAQRIVSIFVCLFVLGAGRQKPIVNDPPSGAWLQTKLKWKNPPASINPQLQASPATILYFGEDHTFAVLICVVNRIPGKDISINDEAGLTLQRGQWTANQKGIAVWSELVLPRTKQWPEGPLWGPAIQQATIRRSHDLLILSDMKFEREPELDDDAHQAMLSTSRAPELPPDGPPDR